MQHQQNVISKLFASQSATAAPINNHQNQQKQSFSKKITGLNPQHKLHDQGFSREQASVQAQSQETQAKGEGVEEGGPYYYNPQYYDHGHRHRPHPQPAGTKTMMTKKTDAIAADDSFFAEIGIQIAPRQQSNGVYQPDFSQIMGVKKARQTVNELLVVPPTLDKCSRKTSEISTADGLTEDFDETLSVKSSAFTNTLEQRRLMKSGADRRNMPQTLMQLSLKQPCHGCQITFWQFADTDNRLCHNCVKIVDAVRTQAKKQDGKVQVVAPKGIATIIVACSKGHRWHNDFRPRQGQRWCRQCRRQGLAEHKARIRQQEEAERERIAAEQEQMYQQAFAQIAADEIAVDPHQRFLERIVDAIVVGYGEEPVFESHGADNNTDTGAAEVDVVDPEDPAAQQQIVEAIIAIGEDRIDEVIQAIFDQVGERHQQRVERRIKFMVHPDRNTHSSAKDAFQMLSNSCWRRKKAITFITYILIAAAATYNNYYTVYCAIYFRHTKMSVPTMTTAISVY